MSIEEMTDEKPLGVFRGLFLGGLLGAILWTLMGVGVWGLLRQGNGPEMAINKPASGGQTVASLTPIPVGQ